MTHTRPRKLLAGILATAIISLGVGGALAPPATATVPGTPGVTQPGTVVFTEDFENGTDNTALGAQSYSAPGSTTYTGASGQAYSGSPGWIDAARCNGVILSYANSDTPAWAVSGAGGSGTENRCADNSTRRSYQQLRMLAKGMGQQFTPGSPDTDHVTSSFTECPSTDTSTGFCALVPAGPNNGVMFKTTKPISTTAGHYYTFGVDTAYINCMAASADPSYQFAKVDADGTVTPIGDPLNGCQTSSDPNVKAYQQQVTSDIGGVFGTVTKTVNINSMTTNQAFQSTGSSMGLEMWNNNGTTNGNDGAFDNVRLVDVTPQLDKSFSPALIGPGQASTLTLTVTNTSELNAKDDWSITDTLPAGVVVASAPNIGGTCVQSAGAPLATTAAAGSGVISVTGGDLAAGQESCTITVDVTSDTEGTYVNGAANIQTNLNPPADATLMVKAPRITLSKALDAPRLSDSDQFTMEIRSGSATGAVVNSTANSTTAGTGSTVAAGSGTTGEYVAAAGSPYYLTESGNGLTGYAQAITCTDANGLQPGLPSGTAFTGSLALTPVAGVDIDCVLTNTAQPAPNMEFTKSADASAVQSPSRVGDVITYTFTAKNTGNTDLTGVVINDPLAGLSNLTYTWPGTPGTLLPGETVVAMAAYAVTQADIDAGHVANSATTSGNPPTGPPVTPPPGTTDTPLTPAPEMSLTKSADASAIQNPSKVGDVITYTFEAKNTGNVKLTGVAINDPLAGLSALTYSWPGTAGELLPGQSVTATATYAITQADIDAGHVVNSATTTGNPPTGPAVTPPPAGTDTPVTPSANMALTKSADASAVQKPSRVGDIITYTFEAKNTGNVALTGVVINDPLPGLSALSYTWPGAAGTLQPGQSVTATATYAVTQADIDAGHVVNTATTTGTPPNGPSVTPPPAGTDTPLTPAPAMELTKSADSSAIQSPAVVGDQVTYSFTAKNTGNVKLTGVTINDPLAGLSALVYSWPGTPGELQPGQSVTATATYGITQADIDAGHVANTATSTGNPPTGPAVTPPPAGTDTALTPGPEMILTKTADASAVQNPSQVGDVITYSFTAKNTGNVKLTGVVINDPLAGLSALTYNWPGAAGELLPGETVTATATYAITQADIDAGHVANTATSTGNPPTGPAVTPPPAGTDTPLTPGPEMILTKTADASAVQNPSQVGDVITYSFTAKNTGNVKLTGVVINDPLAGLSALTYNWPGAAGELLPGETVTATATYAITQADIDAGHVANTATSTGNPPTGPAVTPPPAGTDTPLTPGPEMILTKTADASAVQNPSQVGDVITYSFTAKNTGNVKLTGVVINDPLVGLSALTYNWPGSAGELVPGETVTATATYGITQADIDAGHVLNTATTTGTPPNGPAVTPPPAGTDTPLSPAPAMESTKSADASAIKDPAVVGDLITYTFTAKNTGNVKLTGVVINDPLVGLSALTYNWPGSAGELLPGETVTATATYAITQADIDAGHVVNEATSTGNPPSGPAVTPPPGKTDTPLTPGPAMEFTKTADSSGVQTPSVVGDRINYTFTAKNTGNVTLTDVVINDPLAGLSPLVYSWPGVQGILLPGQTVTATATYAITQADIDAGHVANSATTTGVPPTGTPVTPPPGTTDTPLTPAPAMEFTKSADASAIKDPAVVGDLITYTFTAKNTGNVKLTGVTVNDPLVGLSALTYNWPGSAGELLPGETVTATATYAITQADIDAGHVVNEATSTGNPPSGPAVTPPPGKTDTPLTPSPAMQFTKSADASSVQSPAVVGDQITYTFTAKNSGNVKLTGVVINDPLAGLSALAYKWPGTPGELLPGQTVTATATYAVTQADIDAGHVANSATTTGVPPTGTPVTPPPGTTDTPLVPAPGLEFTKSADATAVHNPAKIGDVITYTLAAKNTGNVTLKNVAISDPLAGLSALNYNWPGTPGELQPGQTVTATATYAIKQADIDAGHVANVATATGTPPTGTPVTPPPGTTDTPLTPAPAMELTKSASAPAAGGTSEVGDLITYTLSAKNTGNVKLTKVSINDPLAGLSALVYSWPGTPGELQPGETVTATATYAITQADIEAGHVANLATSTGTPPSGPSVGTPPVGTDTPLVPAPAMEFSKQALVSLVAGPSHVGDEIVYQFTAKNTGNVKLTSVSIDDPMAGLSALSYTWPGTPGELLPGQTVTAQATYHVTQADIDAGHVANLATTTGTPPTGPAVTPPPAGTDTPLSPDAALEFSKTADASAVGDPAKVGDIITYNFTAKNTGNVTLTDVTIQDVLPGLSALRYNWPGAPGELQPGQTVTATATYAVTQADINAGKVVNNATATGLPPAGPQVTTPPASAVVTFPPVVPAQPGDSLAYTGVVLTALPIGVLVVGAGLFLFLVGRRKRSEA
ncbi:hypothetical protein [Paenarthrobacter sp. NPDC018779]|uniref:DUF7507 domain-containing protein n=1 Tax=Paenarthrobacter sp. NPDC018779 TaxID=3364375 RepID=UPI0037CA1403